MQKSASRLLYLALFLFPLLVQSQPAPAQQFLASTHIQAVPSETQANTWEINYHLDKASRVVVLLENEANWPRNVVKVKLWQKPGEYQLEFNHAHLPKGIYFYSLRTRDFIETKTILKKEEKMPRRNPRNEDAPGFSAENKLKGPDGYFPKLI